jgi:hypothetical protein
MKFYMKFQKKIKTDSSATCTRSSRLEAATVDLLTWGRFYETVSGRNLRIKP